LSVIYLSVFDLSIESAAETTYIGYYTFIEYATRTDRRTDDMMMPIADNYTC